jgi:hypothetical protein
LSGSTGDCYMDRCFHLISFICTNCYFTLERITSHWCNRIIPNTVKTLINEAA